MGGQASRFFYTLKAIPGRGLGLLAATEILKGTRILCEAPLVRIPARCTDTSQAQATKRITQILKKKIAALSAKDRQAFYSLHMFDRGEGSKEFSIFRTNALLLGPELEEEGGSEAGVFLKASRINHACRANSQTSWNQNLEKLTIHACRDIPQGEEITIRYFGETAAREYRQHRLRETFGFTCACALCSLPPPEREASDRRLREIKRLEGSVANKTLLEPAQAMREAERALELLREEGIDDERVSSAWYDAFQVALFAGDAARARVFCERAFLSRIVVEGMDSVEVQVIFHSYMNPLRYPYSFLSSKPSSDPGPHIPLAPDEEFSRSVYEGWLWNREPRTTQTTQSPTENLRSQLSYGGLRSTSTFPAFESLPVKNGPAEDAPGSFDAMRGPASGLSRHWCYLAEITDAQPWIWLMLWVQDRTETKIQFAFHTDRRGEEIVDSLKVGHTVAVLYAEFHFFAFSPPGIRHETPKRLKIFPISMSALLELNDRVERYASLENGIGICHGCDQRKAEAKKYAKCSIFSYCNKDCQAAGWNKEGHKEDCKLLRDPNMKTLLTLNAEQDSEDF
ncbi:SET domain-containing protein 5 [Escovopsis weberi]|uniref:SET domain-containing protein 5 n=1 Tax=Escovopsis weberi TaxID=150374 RepID=A0A0M8MYB0_ESCWE|nr:SET domain-containing protein 5 [Escovopsis weberi]